MPSTRVFRIVGPVLVPVLMVLSGLGLTELAVWQERDRLDSDHHEQVLATAATIRAGLESELNSTVHLASGLAAYIRATKGKPNPKEVQSMLAALYRQGHYLRNMAVAPSNRLTFNYPLQGNEKTLGIYYPKLPNQWPSIARAITSGQPVLSGPVKMIQGGEGLIYRLPVFLENGHYWGLISTVINIDKLFNATLPDEEATGLKLALRGKDGLGAEGEVFRGSPQLFTAPGAVIMDIAISGGQWQLALDMPVKMASSYRLMLLRLTSWVITLLLAFLVWRANQAHRRQRKLMAQLQTQHEKLHGLYELSPLGISLMDEKGRYQEVNGAFSRITGYTEEELKSLTYHDITPDGFHALDEKLLTALQTHGRYGPDEKEYIHKDGSRIPIQISSSLIRGEDGETYIGSIVEDIRQRKTAENQIHLLAFYDPLTNLPNRRLLMDRLGQAMAASSRNQQYGAILFIDLDNFKTLNDTRGHDVGDRLLKNVAQRLSNSVREGDTVARLGGDEFVVMLEDLGSIESSAANLTETVAEKISSLINQAHQLEDNLPSYHGSASIGVSLFRGNGDSVDTLLKQADVALYQAKDAGRNAIRFYNGTMQASLEARAHMEHGLRRALAKGEFALYYQPQIDAEKGLTGAEALLRWRPDGGEMVPPDRFIPIAEDTGLILPIGQWVLEQACIQLSRWQAVPDRAHLQLAVNVSARQFRQQGFVQQVKQTLEDCGAGASGLKLELTESLVLDDVEDTIGKMQALRILGVTFSLDDFGTGYSSLAYLQRLPIDQLKIDKSFVHDISENNGDPDKTAIISAIISMGQSLRLQVIAEGVETEVQKNVLTRHGCQNFQGYLFGRPMPYDAFNALLK